MRNTIAGVDRFGDYVLSSQVYTNARDLARFGLQYLNGRLERREQPSLLPKSTIAVVVSSDDVVSAYDRH
jgi:hypothetical protein